MPAVSLSLLLCLAPAAAGQDSPPPASTVVVTGSFAPGTLAQVNREILVLDADVLQAMAGATLADVLALAATVDLQSRVPGGLFGDLRMRGTSYAGVLVCIDGVRWNDPQTGHFNLEIPVPMDLVERIEVLTGSQSTFFGSEAVGGVINIITRAPGTMAMARAQGGSFGGTSAAALVEGEQGRWRGRVYGGFGHSDGFAVDRDFTSVQAALEGGADLDEGRVRALYTILDSRFGAQGFYGNYPSWEATTEHGLLLSSTLDKGAFAGHATHLDATWRRHDDNFVLFRDRPGLYQNLHSDNTFQLKAVSTLYQDPASSLTADLEASADTLASARLGDHRVERLAAALEANQELAPGLTLQACLRGDHSTRWGGVLTPGAGLAWYARPRLKLRATWGRAFRAPSFTELYYVSPAQVGNAALKPERADSLEAGVDCYAASGAILSLTAYRRLDSDQIDWVRAAAPEPWAAANIGSVRVRGISANASFRPAPWLRCTAGWSSNHQELPVASYTSLYAPDAVRNQVTLSADADLGRRTRLAATWNHKQLALGGTDPSLVGLRLAHREGAIEGFLQGDNLLDCRYREIAGVAMPGRTWRAGLRWSR